MFEIKSLNQIILIGWCLQGVGAMLPDPEVLFRTSYGTKFRK